MQLVIAKSLGGLSTLNLADEVKNSAKVKLLSFNRADVFLYDVIVSENDVLEAR